MEDLRLPKWGLTMEDATIIAWLKQPGETVARGEPIVLIETEKAEGEVESPADGILAEVLVQEKETVPVGALLARIRPAA